MAAVGTIACFSEERQITFEVIMQFHTVTATVSCSCGASVALGAQSSSTHFADQRLLYLVKVSCQLSGREVQYCTTGPHVGAVIAAAEACCSLTSAASHRAWPTCSIALSSTPIALHQPMPLLRGNCSAVPKTVEARCKQPAATSRGLKRRQSCVSAKLSFTCETRDAEWHSTP